MKQATLFEMAKEHFLDEGDHPPIMYVEYADADGRACTDMFYFADFGADTPIKERAQMFDLGVDWARKNDAGGCVTFETITLIGEVWVSSVLPGEKRTWKRPSDDPNRREALLAQIVTLEPTPSGKPAYKQSLARAWIVRPAAGVVDLAVDTPADDEVVVTRLLLPGYFLSGAVSTRMTKEQRAEIVTMALRNVKP